MDLFPLTVLKEQNAEKVEKVGLRNYSSVVEKELPMDQFDSWLKRNRMEGKEEWSFAVKGIAPYEIFRAELRVGEKTVEGSGKSKHWAKQSLVH